MAIDVKLTLSLMNDAIDAIYRSRRQAPYVCDYVFRAHPQTVSEILQSKEYLDACVTLGYSPNAQRFLGYSITEDLGCPPGEMFFEQLRVKMILPSAYLGPPVTAAQTPLAITSPSTPTTKKCDCPIDTILSTGCTCGGI